MMPKWKVDAGNSTSGPVGFVIYGLVGDTKADVLKAIRESYAVLPEETELHGEDEAGRPILVRVYFNANAVTLDQIEEDEDDGPYPPMLDSYMQESARVGGGDTGLFAGVMPLTNPITGITHEPKPEGGYETHEEAVSRVNEPICTSMLSGLQCQLPAGHGRFHKHGTAGWDDGPTVTSHRTDERERLMTSPETVNQYEGWTPWPVGCHWSRGPYTVSTIRTGDGSRSGYVLVKDRRVIAEFVTWADVQRFIEGGG